MPVVLQLAALALFLAPAAASAQTQPILPPHFETEVLVSGAPRTIDFVALADGRILAAEQRGTVAVWTPDGAFAGHLIDLRDEVSHFYDRGLMALALHPGFVPDGGPLSWIYLYYSAGPDVPNGQDDEPAIGRLTRYRVATTISGGQSSLTAIPASRHVLLGNVLPDGRSPDGIPILHESHMGGSLVFGTDGTLLLSTGDGTNWLELDVGGMQPWGFDDYLSPITGKLGPWSKAEDSGAFRAQDVRSLAGKVLRLDPETGGGLPSNPFFDGDPASNRSRVWALGLRNPFRMSRVPGTGAASPADGDPGWLLVADVGAQRFEEVNLVRGGENFGWPCREGTDTLASYMTHVHPSNPHGLADCSTSPIAPTLPALAYPRVPSNPMHPLGVHQDPDGTVLDGFLGVCILGGIVYDGTKWPAEYHGRYLFTDQGYGWLKAFDHDDGGPGASVIDVGELFDSAVAWRMEPGTGDMLVARLGIGDHDSSILAIRYGANATPHLSFTVTPLSEDTPLSFLFDASGSSDPDGDGLTFEWDFGDGSPVASGPVVEHTFPNPGPYTVTLHATDGHEGFASESKLVIAGFPEPTVTIFSPAQGAVFEPGDWLLLSGAGTNGAGGALGVVWHVDLFIQGTWLHDVLTLAQPIAEVPALDFGDPSLDYAWRLRLVGYDGATPVAESSVVLHPAHRVVDVTGPAAFVAKVLELDPPGSQGFGNPDAEVLRDLEYGAPGAGASVQYATYHPAGPAAGAKDWLGYTFGAHHPAGARVFAVELHGGQHLAEGGWFQDAGVEVLQGGAWQPVSHLAIDPPFPPPGSPPSPEFSLRRFTFDPVAADGVRVSGRAGGSLGFVTATELRVLAAAPPGTLRDLTPLAAEPLASTLAFAPPGPQGFGAASLSRLIDGAEPAAGSTSSHAQVSSHHPQDPGEVAWFGVRFDDAVTATAVRFREGLVWSAGGEALGGWLGELTVQTRTHTEEPWVDVEGAIVTPPYRTVGPETPSYEAYTVAFAPRALRELRVVGPPGGSAAFATASELRVLGPHAFGSAWLARFGLGLPADGMALASTTPPAVGLPVLLELADGPSNAPALIVVGSGAATVPLGSGTLLLQLDATVLLPTALGPAGTGQLLVEIPDGPALVGALLPFQAFALDASAPGGVRFSNALDAWIGDE